MKSQTATLSVLSCFTGLGGLDLGLEAAGFTEHLGCIEIDEIARSSLQANRGAHWPLLREYDIADVAKFLTPEDLGIAAGDLKMLVGAPPCQPFSKAGQWTSSARTGMKDPRANSIGQFMSLVERFLPRVLLMENVPGFVQGSVSALPMLKKRMDDINRRCDTHYQLSYQIIEATDFGLPQRRRRAFIFAARHGEALTWPKPTHRLEPFRAWDAIGRLEPHDVPKANGKWADLIGSIPEGSNYLWHTNRGGGQSLFGYRTRYWSFLLKLAKDQPSWTIPASPGPASGPFHWDNRPLSIKERLRLQSFPESWAVEGLFREQVRQVGNATPPLIGEIIARAIASDFFGLNKADEPLVHSFERLDPVPPASTPVEVPKRFLASAGDFKDHPGTGRGPKPRNFSSKITRIPGRTD